MGGGYLTVVGILKPVTLASAIDVSPSDALEAKAAAKGAFSSLFLGLGAVVTAIRSTAQHQAVVVPPEALAGGILAAPLIGAAAGLYPSIRASRLSPTEALRTV